MNGFPMESRVNSAISCVRPELICHPYSCFLSLASQDANSTASPMVHSKFLIFATDRHICLYASPVDGNPFRSLGTVGHCAGVKSIRTDASRAKLFTIGNSCRSLSMWSVNVA